MTFTIEYLENALEEARNKNKQYIETITELCDGRGLDDLEKLCRYLTYYNELHDLGADNSEVYEQDYPTGHEGENKVEITREATDMERMQGEGRYVTEIETYKIEHCRVVVANALSDIVLPYLEFIDAYNEQVERERIEQVEKEREERKKQAEAEAKAKLEAYDAETVAISNWLSKYRYETPDSLLLLKNLLRDTINDSPYPDEVCFETTGYNARHMLELVNNRLGM